MNIKNKFLKLTSRTYPHGTEKDIFPLLNKNLKKDEFGNLFIKIGESDVMFTSHLDTATSANTKVKHVIDGHIIKTDGTSILGADDKAGVTIMLFMIMHNIAGLYYFFLGEEVGCIGSKKVAAAHEISKIDGIKKVISFDRRGTDSVITHQSGRRCCSDNFGNALADSLNKSESTFSYKNDPTGILTDSLQFVGLYPECTNISVGYQNEHTFSEKQDIDHLTKLANACIKIDWNSLPVERDPSTTEYDGYGTYGGYSKYYDYDYDYDYGYSFKKEKAEKTENFWFHDEKYNYVSKLEIGAKNQIKSVDLCQKRVEEEKSLIEIFLKSIDLSYKKMSWDGFKLKVSYNEKGHETECDRNELLEYIEEMDYAKTKKDYLSKTNSNTIYGGYDDDYYSDDFYEDNNYYN